MFVFCFGFFSILIVCRLFVSVSVCLLCVCDCWMVVKLTNKVFQSNNKKVSICPSPPIDECPHISIASVAIAVVYCGNR